MDCSVGCTAHSAAVLEVGATSTPGRLSRAAQRTAHRSAGADGAWPFGWNVGHLACVSSSDLTLTGSSALASCKFRRHGYFVSTTIKAPGRCGFTHQRVTRWWVSDPFPGSKLERTLKP